MPKRPESIDPALLSAWRDARVRNYANNLTPDALARMVVELEDDHGCIPEFEVDEEWPEYVRALRPS